MGVAAEGVGRGGNTARIKQPHTHTLLEVMMMGVVAIAEVGDRSEGTTLIDAELDCP